jgi:DNA-binding MarR family transcriptional regulator
LLGGIKERDRIKLNLSTPSLDKLLDKLEKRNWLRFLEIKIRGADRP